MTEDARRLVTAARDALALHRADKWLPFNVEKAAAVATTAVLRQLALMLDEGEDEGVDDWPDAGDLRLLADGVERSL